MNGAKSVQPGFLQRKQIAVLTVFTVALSLLAATTAQAVDLVNLAAVGGPLVGALTTLGALTPGVKALMGFLGFVVAFISLAAMRNFGPVIYYVGLAVFGAVGLVVAGAILGAVV